MILVPCRIAYLLADDSADSQSVWLEEIGGERRLSIGIGQFEATCIQRALKRETFARPLTHDLLLNVFTALDAKLQAVAIVRVENGTYFATLQVSRANSTGTIDCRPSDALALQSRSDGCELLVAADLFDD